MEEGLSILDEQVFTRRETGVNPKHISMIGG
jgi:hypothetical protein